MKKVTVLFLCGLMGIGVLFSFVFFLIPLRAHSSVREEAIVVEREEQVATGTERLLVLSTSTTILIPVFMYHHIREFRPKDTTNQKLYIVQPKSFEAQMEGLVRAGYHTITPDELFRAMTDGPNGLPTKPAMLTFDDGFRDQYENAFPVLKRLNLKATFFVVSRTLTEDGLSKQMVKEMDASGWITIAAHTQHHVFLTRSSPSKQIEEIAGSKKDLETLLGHEVDSFAYPYGMSSSEVRQEVKDAGFKTAFSIRPGSLHTTSTQFTLPRIRIADEDDVPTIAEAYGRADFVPTKPDR